MTKTITRAQVVQALRTEPVLKRGKVFHEGYRAKKGCPVCAVGAVLRKVSFEKYLRKHNGGDAAYYSSDLGKGKLSYDRTGEQEWMEEIENKNWLNALSVYFESGKTRRQCIEFVEKNFPPKFKFRMEA